MHLHERMRGVNYMWNPLYKLFKKNNDAAYTKDKKEELKELIESHEQDSLVMQPEAKAVSQPTKQQVGGYNQDTWDKVEDLIAVSEQYVSYNFKSLDGEVFKDYNGQNSYEIYLRGIELLNREIDKLERQGNIYCVCSKGCSYCCEQAIYLSCAEQEIISKKLLSMPNEDISRIKDRNNKVLEIMKLNKIPLTMGATDGEMAEKVNNDFLRLQIRCPLLDDNGNCSIYEVRPTSCWPYRNYGHKIDCKGKIAEHSYPHVEMASVLTGRLNMDKSLSGKNIYISESLPKLIKDVLGQ